MGFLSGMTAGLYRYTVDGRRLFYLRLPAPSSMRPAYLVSAREQARVKAMGEGTIITLLILGALLIAVQMTVLIQDHYWWSFAGTLMFGAAEIQLARQLYVLRRM